MVLCETKNTKTQKQKRILTPFTPCLIPLSFFLGFVCLLVPCAFFLSADQELERVMSLFARSYSTLRADTLAARTGLSVENAVQVAVDRYGWSYDKSAALLQPAKASPAPAANARDIASARLNPENTQVPLDFLQGIVSHLEQ